MEQGRGSWGRRRVTRVNRQGHGCCGPVPIPTPAPSAADCVSSRLGLSLMEMNLRTFPKPQPKSRRSVLSHTSLSVSHHFDHLSGSGCFFLFFFYPFPASSRASLVAQLAKNPPAIRETWVRSLGWEDPLEKEKATHSSILAWRIPWTV